MINDLPLRDFSNIDIAIVNLLSTKKTQFKTSNDYFIDIGINKIEKLDGFKVQCLYGEHQLTFYFNSSQLQKFWEDVLKATSFEIIPMEFQIEILSSIFELYKNELIDIFKNQLIIHSISTIQKEFKRQNKAFVALIKNGKKLVLWIEENIESTISLLPDKKHNLYKMKFLNMSFGIGFVNLTQMELLDLESDDVIFLEKNYLMQNQLVVLISNKPIWRCSFNETSLNILSSENEDVMVDDNIRIKSLPLVLTFEIGNQIISLDDLNKLQEQYVFELHSPLEQQVKLKINGIQIGVGELVKIKDHIGVRVKTIYQDSTDDTQISGNGNESNDNFLSEDVPPNHLDENYDSDHDVPLDNSD